MTTPTTATTTTTINMSLLPFCPNAETFNEYTSRIEEYGKMNKLSKEQIQKLLHEGLPENSEQLKIDAINTSAGGTPDSKMGSTGSMISSSSSMKKKPKKLSDFVHSIFIMIALISVLILFIRHFSIEAAENHNSDGNIDE